MAERKVVWTETAFRQRREILKYWTKRNKSPNYAENLIFLIRERIKVISQNLEAFKFSVFPNTGVSAMGHFSLYYKFFENQIIIIAFWDNRQNPKKLFKILNNEL